ncbi:MAG: hypothetical protein PSX36_00525 [bacterium]|nr:hypothetical protein [bacterium]
MIVSDFERIEKEKMEQLKFPKRDVLKSARDIEDRSSELSRALVEARQNNARLKIYFEDEKSRKVVETSIWGLTNKQVILDSHVGIPISRIHSVKP